MSKFDEKFAEARYFLGRMRAEAANTDPLPLTANLRACVGAARSVALYAEEDAFELANGRCASGPGELGKDPAVKRTRKVHEAERVLTFFQELRNSDVHVRPSGSLKKEEHRLRVVAFDSGGTSEPTFATLFTWSLAEWPQSGPDAFTLCEQYLEEVESFLRRAVSDGLIRR